MMLDDGPGGVTYHIGILLQDRELDAGNFDGKQNASSNARDACTNDGNLKRRQSHSVHVEILRTILETNFQYWGLVYRMLPELK